MRFIRFVLQKFLLRASRSKTVRKVLNWLPKYVAIRFVYFSKRLFLGAPPSKIDHTRLNSTSQLIKSILAVPDLLDLWQDRSKEHETVFILSELQRKQDNYIFSGILENKSVLTLDFWDTLIGRYRPAEAVKRNSALYISLFYWKKSGYLKERISEKTLHETRLSIESYFASQLIEPSIEDIFSNMIEMAYPEIYTSSDIPLFIDYEISKECANTYPINAVCGHLIDKDFDVISDHFYNSDQLRIILDHHGVSPKNVYSSSQIGSSKKNNGDLYSTLGFDVLEDWHHIGDNIYSDIQNAKIKGASVSLVHKENKLPWHIDHIDEIALLDSLPELLGLSSFNKLLCTISELSYFLVTFAIETACEFKKCQIVYLSREGKTLYDFHAANKNIFADLPLDSIKPIYFPSSRTSLFMASYSSNLQDIRRGLEEIALQYPLMNGKTFCTTLGLPKDLSEEISKINPEKLLSPVQIFDSLPIATSGFVMDFLATQSLLVKQQLQHLGVNLENSIFCDLGWRGSMQDSLNRILGKEQRSVGVYLGVLEPYSKSSSTLKLGLLNKHYPKTIIDHILNFPGPLERIFTFNSQSTVSYYRDDLGEILPTLSEREEIIQERIESYVSNFSFVAQKVGASLYGLGFFGSGCSEVAMRLIKRFYEDPNYLEAATWFDEKHSEGFGAGDKVHYRIQPPLQSWFHAGMSKDIYKAIIESRWPNGYHAWITRGKSKIIWGEHV